MTLQSGCPMKASLIQMNSQENKAANLAQAKRLIEEAVAADRPDLVLLPEMFTHLSENREAKKAAAETLPGGDRKSTRLNSSHVSESRMPSSA